MTRKEKLETIELWYKEWLINNKALSAREIERKAEKQTSIKVSHVTISNYKSEWEQSLSDALSEEAKQVRDKRIKAPSKDTRSIARQIDDRRLLLAEIIGEEIQGLRTAELDAKEHLSFLRTLMASHDKLLEHYRPEEQVRQELTIEVSEKSYWEEALEIVEREKKTLEGKDG